jgi:preprotein translocase subunit SecG
MESIIIIVHVIAAIAIIGLVLIQHGKGADMGASFGSGGSQTMFGSVGSGNVLTKSTTILAVVFFLTSLGLAMVARDAADLSVVDNSLISDIEQVNAEISAEAQAALSDLPVVEVESTSDLPVINDLPVVEE